MMTAMWTSAKEVALLLGTMAQRMPLPGGGRPSAEGAVLVDVLSGKQLQAMGALLLRLLLEMKHNGVVEKASIGMFALAGRLLV